MTGDFPAVILNFNWLFLKLTAGSPQHRACILPGGLTIGS